MPEHSCPVESCDRTVSTERGLNSHISQVHPERLKYNDAEWLREKYVGQEMSIEEIAQELGCSLAVISRKLEEHGIGARSTGYVHRKPYMPYQMGPYGRMVWRSTRGTGDGKEAYGFEVHRLLAIAEHGTEAVAGMDVHHQNHIPWDNRPENLELLSKEEHGKLHSDDYYNND